MRTFLTLIFVSFLSPSIAQTAMAEQHAKTSVQTLTIEHVWAKPNFGPNGAVYFTLMNSGTTTRHLTGAASPFSNKVELHTHKLENGIMKMRQLKEPLKITPGSTVTFAPGGLHVMLFGMEKKFKTGETLPATLKFKDGSTIPITATVRMQANKKMENHHH